MVEKPTMGGRHDPSPMVSETRPSSLIKRPKILLDLLEPPMDRLLGLADDRRYLILRLSFIVEVVYPTHLASEHIQENLGSLSELLALCSDQPRHFIRCNAEPRGRRMPHRDAHP